MKANRLRFTAFCLCAAAVLAWPSTSFAQASPASVERGYRLMYSLDFDAADREFSEWQRVHPGDALAPVSRAANVLFREFDRLGVLQARLFQDNAVFTSTSKRAPDPMLAKRFEALLTEAETAAQARLVQAPQDRDALFSMTLVNGLRADYAALIEQRNMAALSYTRQATTWATKLLAIAPDYYDAYMATGMSAYLVGSLPLPVRWVLRIGGYQGDKSRGVRELKLVAERGRLLAPFARILLAVASLRDQDVPRARVLLAGLAREFPSNPLFERELRRLDGPGD
ncbi:MAG: hypothetical protein ACM3NQ_07460 [Bacteroidales bacterium]